MNLAPSKTEPKVGDIVCVEAVDWAVYNEQTTRNASFDIVRGLIYGELIAITDDGLVVASQAFNDGGVRNVLAVPKVCVLSVTILEAE